MKIAYCPYCNNRTLVDERDWGLTVQCEGPRCERFFTTAHLAAVERVSEATRLPVPEPAPSATATAIQWWVEPEAPESVSTESPQPQSSQGAIQATLRITDFLVRDALVPALRVPTREDAVRVLVGSLRDAGRVAPIHSASIISVIDYSTREPRAPLFAHAIHNSLDRLVGTLGAVSAGVAPFSHNGSPVYLLILLLGPSTQDAKLGEAIRALSRCLVDNQMVSALRCAGTREAMWACLEGWQDQDLLRREEATPPLVKLSTPPLPRYAVPPHQSTERNAPSPPSAPLVFLTAPHRCQVCKGEFREPLGRRRCTVLHRPLGSTQADNCRTDVYAALYRCPHCRVRLETPSYQWGQAITCPACLGDFTAPYDDVLHRLEGDAREGQPFHFDCPACGRRNTCDTHREGQPTRGLPVVCVYVHCSQLIEVPGGGSAVRSSTAAPLIDPMQALQQGPERRCENPACGQMIPVRAPACPVCGTPLPPYLPGE